MQLKIADNYFEILKSIPDNVSLVAVSKTHPASTVQDIYNCGQRKFGENRVQELVEKAEQLPADIQWHQIGHLQTNKVKYIAPFVTLIESVDTEKLLKEIDRQALNNNRKIDVLLQIKISQEDTKSGMEMQTAEEILKNYDDGNYPQIVVRGFMGMATFTDNQEQLKQEFSGLHDFYFKHQEQYALDTLSMGMSGDYLLAIECGSNSVRVGYAIFGSRN